MLDYEITTLCIIAFNLFIFIKLLTAVKIRFPVYAGMIDGLITWEIRVHNVLFVIGSAVCLRKAVALILKYQAMIS